MAHINQGFQNNAIASMRVACDARGASPIGTRSVRNFMFGLRKSFPASLKKLKSHSRSSPSVMNDPKFSVSKLGSKAAASGHFSADKGIFGNTN